MTIKAYDHKTGKWTTSAEDAPSFEPVLTAEEALAAKRASAIEEMVADTERKRLDAIRTTVAVAFKDANSEKDVADKLVQLKAARRG